MKKRILSFLLAFVMLVGMLPMTAMAADGYTITTGDTTKPSSWQKANVISQCVITGAAITSSTVSDDCLTWDVYLPSNTDTSAELSYTISVKNNRIGTMVMKAQASFNGAAYVKTKKDTSSVYTATFSGVPEWSNGEATVTFAVASDGKAANARTYTLKLHIDDGVNDAPVLTGEKSAAKTLRVDDTYELNLSGIFKDSDSKELSYKVSINEGDPVIAAANYSYVPKETGTHTLVFTASDGELTSEAYTVTLTVIENVAPALAGEATATETGIQNQAWKLDLGKVFTDEEGDALTYTVAIDGAEPVAADAGYSYTPAEAGEYTLVFQATDIKGDVSPSYTVTLKVTKNTAPVLVDGSELSADAMHGLPWTLDLTKVFADNEADPLTYTVSVNGAATVSANAGYSYTPTAAGTDTLVFQAADGKDSVSPVYTVTLNVAENPAPVLTGDASASASVDQYKVWNINLVPLFKDNDGDSLTYSVSVDGAAAVSANANYSYTANTSGEKPLAFFATDKAGNVSSAYTVTLTVNYVPRTVIATGCAKQAGKSFDAWVGSITVTGPVITEYQWIGGTGHDETSDSEHVLNILLDPATPDDATITLAYTLDGETGQGTVSGTTTLTLENGIGTAKATSKAKNIASWAQTRNYTINFANKQNSAPVATQPTATAQVATGSDFTIDLSKVFSDPDGDAMTYTVTCNEETVATESTFTQTMGTSGTFTFTFAATDTWNETTSHTVTVTVEQSDTKYEATVKVPEDITPEFYITNGFDSENLDICGDTLTATAGTAENGFVPYTVQVPENVSRISFRGKDADGNAWGGMSAEIAKDMEPVTVVKVLGVIPSKVNNVYATAQQALFQLKDKDGYYVTSGSTATDDYGIVNYRFLAVAFGTDDLALAYTAYVVPQGGAEAQYLTTIGSNKTFTKEQPQQITQLGMTLKSSFTVTVPEGATVQAFQWNRYYSADEIPVSDTVKNEDGTVSWIFVKGNASYMTYRASMEGKLTKVGYVNGDAVTITWSDSDPEPSSRTPYDTSTLYGSRGDDSMVVNVNGQNHLVMTNGGTFRLRGYRIWEVINNDTNNVMIQPDMHYTLTGDKIVTVTPVNTCNGNGKNNWLDLKATGNGVAYLEMSYDAMQVVTGNATAWGGAELAGFVFNACDPARTALVVVQVGNAATDVSFGIKNTSTINGSAVPWDAEFDTLYFTGSCGKLELTPTVSSGSIAKVEVSGDKGASWTELTAADGVYTAEIISGNNILRVTKTDGTESYQVVRGDKVSVTMTETNGDGDNVPEPGETFRLQLNGVHNPIGKMSGNYNPGYGGGQHLYYKFNGSTVYTTVNYQYNFVSNAWVEVTIPETAKPGDTFTLDNGYIGFNVIGITDFLNSKENHRGITDEGHMTRGATGTNHQRSILPEITLTVRNSEAEVNNVIALIDAIESATDKATAIQAARTAYAALSDAQKAQVTNYEKLTAAEKALADAADAAAAEAVEDRIRQIGGVTLEDEAAIRQAWEAYNALTQTQKDLVDPDLLLALENAEAELIVLKDKKVAKEVDDLIAAIGEVTLEKESQIEAAKAAYAALTAAQKKHVTKLHVLEEAEQKLQMLKNTGGVDYGLAPDEIIGYVTVSFEDYGVRVEGENIDSAYKNPRGVIVSATKVPFKAYDTIASVTLRLLKAKSISASYQGSEFSGFYLSSVGGFGEFDAGSGSGWMVTWNDWFINKGASEFAVKDGDVVKWQYTCQLGADIGDNSYYKSVEDVIDLIDAIGTVTLESEEAIEKARAAYNKLSAKDKKRVNNYAELTAAEAALAALKGNGSETDQAIAPDDIYKATGDHLENLGIPAPGSVGGEWMVIGLIRSGRDVPAGYYDNAVKFVQENIDENERLHSAKSTENSRMILALTALGKDVTNVDGHNLLSGLTDMAYVRKQGINGPIWALIAFDSGNYPVPTGGDVTRQALIQVILDAQLSDGGWAISGSTSDPDMTGMALQALAPYYNTDADVKKAVDVALIALSEMQQADGSFSSIDGTNIESIAQVVTALAALGIDAEADPRFIKNSHSALDALCAFYVEDGGFRHTLDGKLDGMATEQGYYALTAYFRMLDGKTALYDMTDVIDMGGDVTADEPIEETEPAPTEPVDTPQKDGRSFPWWLVIVIVVLAGAIVVLVIISKPKKGRHTK